jgi:hypothetical protein
MPQYSIGDIQDSKEKFVTGLTAKIIQNGGIEECIFELLEILKPNFNGSSESNKFTYGESYAAKLTQCAKDLVDPNK